MQQRVRHGTSLDLGQPTSDYPHEIDRGGNQHMLQMRFRQTNVARPAHAKRTHSLGDGAFNTGSSGILFLKVGGELTFTHGLESFVVQLWPHFTGLTVLLRKADLDHLLTCPVAVRMPFGTLFASWTHRSSRRPIDSKWVKVEWH